MPDNDVTFRQLHIAHSPQQPTRAEHLGSYHPWLLRLGGYRLPSALLTRTACGGWWDLLLLLMLQLLLRILDAWPLPK